MLSSYRFKFLQKVSEEILQAHSQPVFRLDPTDVETRYLACLEADTSVMFTYMYKISRPGVKNLNKVLIRHHIKPGDLTAEAFSYLDGDKDAFATCDYSLGLILSIDDWFMRLVSHDSFLSQYRNINGEVTTFWNGCLCVDYENSDIQPNVRFYDYSKRFITSNLSASNNPQSCPISRYFLKSPTDPERINLADSLAFIGIFWVMMHEEAHAFAGHLGYATREKVGLLKVNEHSGRLGLGAHSGIESEDRTTERLLQVIEYWADCEAAKAVADCLIQPSTSDVLYVSSLSQELKFLRVGKPMIVRSVLTAIGCVILVLRKSEILSGRSECYPTARTRLFSVFPTFIGQCIRHSKFDLVRNGELDPEGLKELRTLLIDVLFDLDTAWTLAFPERDNLADTEVSEYEAEFKVKNRSTQFHEKSALFSSYKEMADFADNIIYSFYKVKGGNPTDFFDFVRARGSNVVDEAIEVAKLQSELELLEDHVRRYRPSAPANKWSGIFKRNS